MSGFALLTPFRFAPPVVASRLIYTGDGLDNRNITGMAFKPDLTWHFHRTGAGTRERRISDIDRGATTFFDGHSANSGDQTGANDLQSFIEGGFQVGSGVLNIDTETYGAWGWKKGVDFGFDTVLYTGSGVAKNITHNLGGVPDMIHVRKRSTGVDSRVYHSQADAGVSPKGYFMLLENWTLEAFDTENWDNTAPGASVFRIGDGASVNINGGTYVTHLWRAIPGKSFFGKYSGTGAEQSITGLGFRPSMLLTKARDGGGGSNESGWRLWDDTRGLPKRIRWDTTSAEDTNNQYVKTFDSDGFTVGTSNVINKSGDDYVFGAWK